MDGGCGHKCGLGVSAQDSGVETQGIGVVIDAHALVDVVNDEIVFDTDDPTEAGAAFALGTNKDQTFKLQLNVEQRRPRRRYHLRAHLRHERGCT